MRIYFEEGNAQRDYAERLECEEELLGKYPVTAPLTEPGDVVLLDFLVAHASGLNTSDRPRWSMQLRYFNFADPTGIRISWLGAYAAGNRITDVHPELVVNRASQ